MTLQFISIDSTPNYIAQSTDISGSKIAGASSVGYTVLTTDDNKWYIIKPDLTLGDYVSGNSGRYVDTLGQSHGYISNGGLPLINTETYLQLISEGKVPNCKPFIQLGLCPATAATEYTVWNVAADYIFPSSGMRMAVSSTSTEDSSSGSGIRSLTLYYLDDNFVEKEETVTLNGTNAVQTSESSIYRINDVVANTAGSTKKAVGVISIKGAVDNITYEQLAIGQTKSRTAVYTVPFGKKAYIMTIFMSVGANASGKRNTVTTRTNYDRYALRRTNNGIFLPYSETTLVDQAITLDLQIPSALPTGTDLKICVQGEAGAVCAVHFRGWLETL